MSTQPRPGQNARLVAPRLVHPNEEFAVRLLIQHPMETGFRRDDSGKPVPANSIETIRVEFEGELLWQGHVLNALAANPSITVRMAITKPGTFRANWRDQEGNTGSISAEVKVVGA
jgi:sulfur-oxidizing protein SoxZ